MAYSRLILSSDRSPSSSAGVLGLDRRLPRCELADHAPPGLRLESTRTRRPSWTAAAGLCGGVTVVVAVLALCCGIGPVGVTAHRVSAAIGPEFNNVTLVQQGTDRSSRAAGAKLDVLPNCTRHCAVSLGSGRLDLHPERVSCPSPESVPFQQTPVDI